MKKYTEKPDLRRPHILVVDDHIENLDNLEVILSMTGYNVETARSGEEAYFKVINPQTPFDIVLTDIKMSPMNGIELLEKIREFDSEIIVIMMTGYSTMDNAIAAIRNGAYDYLEKPFQMEQLILALQRGYAKRTMAQQNQQLIKDLKQKTTEQEITLRKLEETQQQLLITTTIAAINTATGTLDHELRNPLTTISTILQICSEKGNGLSPEKLGQYLTTINGEINRIIQTLQTLKNKIKTPVFEEHGYGSQIVNIAKSEYHNDRNGDD